MTEEKSPIREAADLLIQQHNEIAALKEQVEKLQKACQEIYNLSMTRLNENLGLGQENVTLRENIAMGEEAMRLQAASFKMTVDQQQRTIKYLEGRDYGTFAWVLRGLHTVGGNPDLNIYRRKGWNGKGMWIGLQRPTDTSKMTLPYIFMYTAQGDYVPWLASQSDMLADDWEEA